MQPCRVAWQTGHNDAALSLARTCNARSSDVVSCADPPRCREPAHPLARRYLTAAAEMDSLTRELAELRDAVRSAGRAIQASRELTDTVNETVRVLQELSLIHI
eukprot:4607228-Alexandrium_andersonii.AAC.1